MTYRRLFDILAAGGGLALLAAPLGVILLLVWLQDWRSPFYVADRVGKDGRPFRMVKVRSMIVGADKSGLESTAADDARITAIGHFVRRWKIDELSQLWNVLIGDMSLVGPRPNTVREVMHYTPAERALILVKPGITDIASIVFSDEGEILRGAKDPERCYNELIRPWKSRLGLLYVRNASVALDLKLIWLTIVAIFDRPRAIQDLAKVLRELGADPDLVRAAARASPLVSSPLP